MLAPDFLAYGALEAFITVANSLTRSLLRDQCGLPDGCVTAHASARATPLPNDISSEILTSVRISATICAAFSLRRPTQLSRHSFVSYRRK
jgi:hypothetical protein